MTSTVLPHDVLGQIARAIAGIHYGSVHITIQDSRVIQIEKAERFRLQQGADLTPGGVYEPVGATDRTTGGSSSSRGP